MSSIKDEIRIDVAASKAYAALTTQAGYRGWWNKVAEVPDHVGGEAVLRFNKDGTIVNMRWRIDEQVPERTVKWTCTAHDMASWVGTTITWTLTEAAGSTLVALDHAGWADAGPDPVKQGWHHFLGSMKAYLETGTGQPW